MDAAHKLKKTAFFLSAALAFAAPSYAQIQVAPSTVTLNGNAPSTVSVTAGGGSPLTYTVTPQGFSAGFAVSDSSSNSFTTPDSLSISATQVTCAAQGVSSCTGSLLLKGSDSSTATITVTFSNGTGGGGGGGGNQTFQASPTAVTITAMSGGIGQATVSLTSNSATAIMFNYGNISPSGSWLSVTQTGGSSGQVSATSPATLTIAGNAFGLTNATLNGSITLNPSSGAPVTINVTFQVGSGGSTRGSLVATPNTVSFSYPSGTLSLPVLVSSTTAAQFTATSGSTWLTVNGVAAGTVGPLTVGQSITLAVDQTAAPMLSTGPYNTTVTLANVANASDVTTVPVSLSVNGSTGGGGGVAAPTSVSFAYQSGGSAPYQVILVSGGVTQATFTPTAGNWPNPNNVVSFTSGTNQIYVSVPNGLTASGSASVNTGTVTVTNGSNSSQAIPITLTVYPTGTPTLLVGPSGQADYTCTFVAGQQNCGSSTYTISASEGPGVAISAASSVNWATVSCSSPSTPSFCTVQVSPSSLPNGLNTGVVTVSASSTTTNSSIQIPVVVLVGGNSGGNTGLTVSPSTPLSFTGSGTQQLTVSGQNIAFNATAATSTPQGGNWLSISPAGNLTATPSGTVLNVSVNAAGLPASSTAYSGSITLTANGATQTIPVSLTVGTGGNVTVTAGTSPGGAPVTSMSFTAQAGGAAPAGQAIYIAAASGSSGGMFTYSATTTTGGNWLQINGNGTSTMPTSLTVTVNPSGLAASTTAYAGSIMISPSGGSTVTIPVSFTVTPASTVSASPTSLTFSYTAGSGNTPSPQTINVSGTGTFSASASSTGNWCQVSPTSGTAPMSLTVSLSNLDSLAANQSYTCTIAVTGTGTTVGSATVTATLTVTAPLPTIIKVTNAASFNAGSIAAGEIITIFGTGIGPSTGVSSSATNGQYPTTLGGVQVLVGGFPAAMIYASATQVSAAVPYEINRPVFLQSVNVQVKYLNQTSNGIPLTQVAAAPGIFTANASGSGPGAILNANLSVNSSSNPASAGSIVVLYVTGEGQTIPAGATGSVNPSTPPFTVPVQAPTVTINGQPAQVAFYGEAPTLIEGVLQINVVIPQSAGAGDRPVVVSFGGASSQLTSTGVGAVTVSVR